MAYKANHISQTPTVRLPIKQNQANSRPGEEGAKEKGKQNKNTHFLNYPQQEFSFSFKWVQEKNQIFTITFSFLFQKNNTNSTEGKKKLQQKKIEKKKHKRNEKERSKPWNKERRPYQMKPQRAFADQFLSLK